MGIKVIGFALSAVLYALCLPVEAQQAAKVPRIGFLRSGSAASTASDREAFLQGLRDLGYVDGKNIMIEYRYADGKPERWPELAAELVNAKVGILVTAGIGPTRAARQATATIPIIVGTAGDLVRAGLVVSLAKPGGNITGLTEIAPDLAGKRLELLKEILPTASRIAVLWHTAAGASDDDEELKELELAARQFNVNILAVGVRDVGELQNAYKTIAKTKPDAKIILRNSVTMFHRQALAHFAVKERMPTVCDGQDFVQDGCLISYGAEQRYLWRRAANFVDKILKGAKPADIPVEQPTKFELIINLKAAKQIGLTIPPNVLARADRVIR